MILIGGCKMVIFVNHPFHIHWQHSVKDFPSLSLLSFLSEFHYGLMGSFYLSFLKIYLFIFRESEREGERRRESSMCGCLSHTPNWGPGEQPRYVPWLGIELATLVCRLPLNPLNHTSQSMNSFIFNVYYIKLITVNFFNVQTPRFSQFVAPMSFWHVPSLFKQFLIGTRYSWLTLNFAIPSVIFPRSPGSF